MDYPLGHVMRNLSESATIAVASKARELRAQGVDLVDFGAGEPDFDTPAHIKAAALAALEAGDTKYPTPPAGREALRRAIGQYVERYFGLGYGPHEICVTAGGKDGLGLAFLSLLSPGDEVIIPAPYWVSFPALVRIAGGTPVEVSGDAETGKLDPRRLAGAITPRTRILVLNSPCNPAGFTYSRGELEAIAEVLRPTGVLVFSDEIYHRLAFADELPATIASVPGMRERTLLVDSASKTYAMTGWRVGYVAGPAEIVKAIVTLKGQSTNGPTSFVQSAFMAALTGDQACVEEMRCAYRRRGERMHAALSVLPDVRCLRPTGGFFCFADVSRHYRRLDVPDSVAFARLTLERAHVALVPGVAFGWDTHVRMSFATSDAQIEEGIRRFSELMR